MTTPDHERIRDVFAAVCDLPAAEQAAEIERRCGGDEALRAEVEILIELDRPGGGLLDEQAVERGAIFGADTRTGGAPRPDPERDLPDAIDGYSIERHLGDGGMGSVYLATQASPRRSVALKLMRATAPSSTLRRRFLVEAQVLGLLRHPGIAAIHEAGIWRDGGQAPVPYFVMEYVDGQPVDVHARRRDLSIDDRVRLMVRICEAVNAAHQRGVVHRDLKPDNLLVIDEPAGAGIGQPKVLDFGIAKVTGADLDVTAVETGRGQLVGTLPYMSPEQVAGDPNAVDARTDVYSLAVILFQLLAGQMPYDVRGRSVPEAATIIRDDPPTSLSRLDRRLGGDLEVIIRTALEKDPADRYQSVADFAADLRRWLTDEPITARPPSAYEQIVRFARRHRPLVAGVLVAFLALVVGLAGTGLFAWQAVQRERAERWTSYRARIDAATAAAERGDRLTAVRVLDEAPTELRGWEWGAVRRLLDNWIAVVPFEGRAIDGAWLLPGGTRLAAGLADDTLGVWDLATGDRTLHVAIDGGIAAVDGARGRHEAAVLTVDGQVVFVDLADGRILETFDVVFPVVPSGASDAGETGVSGDTGDRHDTAGGDDGTDAVRRRSAVVLDPLGRFAVVSRGGVIVCLDRTGTVAWERTLPFDTPRRALRLRIAPDGRTLAVGRPSRQRRFLVFQLDMADGTELARSNSGHGPGLMPLAADAGFVSGSIVRDVHLHDAEGERTRIMSGHSGNVMSLAVDEPRGTVLSIATDGAVREHVIETGRARTVAWAPAGSRAIRLSDDGERFVTTVDDRAYVWATRTRLSPVLAGHESYVYYVAFSPDGDEIASVGFQEDTIRTWDGRTGAPRSTIPGAPRSTGLSYSADGRSLRLHRRTTMWQVDRTTGVVGPRDETTATDRAWQRAEPRPVPQGRRQVLLPATGQTVRTLGDEPGIVVIRDVEGTEVGRLDHASIVSTLAVSGDGRRLAIGGADGSISLWDLGRRRRLAAVQSGHGTVYGLAFHPTEARLASGGNDGVVSLRALPTLDLVLELRGHTSYVHDVAFSPDGTRLVSASGDRTLRLWDSGPRATGGRSGGGASEPETAMPAAGPSTASASPAG